MEEMKGEKGGGVTWEIEGGEERGEYMEREGEGKGKIGVCVEMEKRSLISGEGNHP